MDQTLSAAIIVSDIILGEHLHHLVRNNINHILIDKILLDISEAELYLKSTKVDFVFLEDQVGGESGFNLLSKFNNRQFEVIIIANTELYAFTAYQHQCLCYFLKPIVDSNLIATVLHKLKLMRYQSFNKNSKLVTNDLPAHRRRLVLPSPNGIDFIDINTIIMAKADGNYTNIFTDNNSYLCSKTLKDIEDILPNDVFFRTHKSYLVNLNKVEKYNKLNNELVLKGGLIAEIAVRRKDDFLFSIVGPYQNKEFVTI